jgi:hypothetical protein
VSRKSACRRSGRGVDASHPAHPERSQADGGGAARVTVCGVRSAKVSTSRRRALATATDGTSDLAHQVEASCPRAPQTTQVNCRRTAQRAATSCARRVSVRRWPGRLPSCCRPRRPRRGSSRSAPRATARTWSSTATAPARSVGNRGSSLRWSTATSSSAAPPPPTAAWRSTRPSTSRSARRSSLSAPSPSTSRSTSVARTTSVATPTRPA